ncbi:MAG: TolC family protein [Pseudomonadota bacterium]
MKTIAVASLALVASALAGCATFSEDGGFGGIGVAVKERSGAEARWIRNDADAQSTAREVKRLLAEPLGPEQAVAVALLNNRGLQAAFAEVGISEAERVQAGRWINPGFSYARLERGDVLEIERKLVFSLIDLFTLPRRSEIASQRLERAKLGAAGEALRLAAEARRAWFEAVAAREAEKYFEQAQMAAEASAELSERMARIGNVPKLQRLREQTFLAEAGAELARARQGALAARERLVRVLGLAGEDTAFKLAERLPELPKAPREAREMEATALRERLDVRAAKHEAEALAASLGLTEATRFVNVLEIGWQHNSATGEPAQKGWELELRLPIFDTGDARLARAQHQYMQAVNRAAQVAVNARSEVRETYHAYRTAYQLASRYRDEIVPLRRQISEENLLRYNGMLIGVFELIADARQTMASVNASIEALRDFWLAESALQAALTAGSTGGAPSLARTAARAPEGAEQH